jgi:hypothetical protein
MNNIDVTAAPGCYGLGMLYKPASNECKTCPFGQTCGPIAGDQLLRLRAELGIVAPPAPKVRKVAGAAPTPSAHPTTFMPSLPKKVQEVMDWIDKQGIRVGEALAQGINPFTARPQFLRVTCHLLLKQRVGIKRDLLCHCFMTKLEWSKGTADAHVIQAVQVLKALGVADEVDGRLALKGFQ